MASTRNNDILCGVERCMFTGDSLTDGSDYPDYVLNTINAQRPLKPLQGINSAIAGNTSEDLVRRLDRDILSQHADLVSICIGTNDLIYGRPIAEYSRNLEYVIVRVLESRGKVLLVAPSPFGDARMEQKFQSYLKIIYSLGRKYACPVAEAHGLFTQSLKRGKKMLWEDGIHHDAEGVEGMARAILHKLGFIGVPLNRTVAVWPHVLTEWDMSPPIPNDVALTRLRKIKRWVPYDRLKASVIQPWYNASFPARGAFMPFLDGDSVSGEVIFGRSSFVTETDCAAEMQIGARALRVWVNGVQRWQLTPENYAGMHPAASRFPITLKKGQNEIIVMTNWFSFVAIRRF